MAQTYTYRGRQWAILDPQEPLQIGDVILLRFNWLSAGTYSKAAQWASIEEILGNRPDFEIVSYINTEGYLEAEIKVTQTHTVSTRSEDVFDDPWAGKPGGIFHPLGPVVGGALVVVTAAIIFEAFTAATIYLVARSAYKYVLEPTKETIEDLSETPGGQVALAGVGAAGVALLIGVGILAAMKLGVIK